MTEVSTGRVRFSGVVLIVCVAALLFGRVLLLYVSLSWVMPEWIPIHWRHAPQGAALPIRAAMDSAVGLSALYLVVFGVVGGLNGLWMVSFGTRNWVLMMPLILLFLIFLAVGAWATLDSQGFSRWLETLHS